VTYFSCHVDSSIAVLKLSRDEKLNALNRAMLAELEERLIGLENNDSIRALIIRGGDRAFCAGADLMEVRSFDEASLREWIESGHRIFNRLASFPCPTLAAIRGYALGGGLELALACDFRLAATDATFGHPEVGHGWIPGWGGVTRLPRLIGEARAKEVVLLGSRLDAGEALRLGVLHRVYQTAEFEFAVAAFAHELASKNPTAMRVAKRILTVPNSAHDIAAECDGSIECLRAALQ
jgi:enoyl-CoA hydratase/carnithine racemase